MAKKSGNRKEYDADDEWRLSMGWGELGGKMIPRKQYGMRRRMFVYEEEEGQRMDWWLNLEYLIIHDWRILIRGASIFSKTRCAAMGSINVRIDVSGSERVSRGTSLYCAIWYVWGIGGDKGRRRRRERERNIFYIGRPELAKGEKRSFPTLVEGVDRVRQEICDGELEVLVDIEAGVDDTLVEETILYSVEHGSLRKSILGIVKNIANMAHWE